MLVIVVVCFHLVRMSPWHDSCARLTPVLAEISSIKLYESIVIYVMWTLSISTKFNLTNFSTNSTCFFLITLFSHFLLLFFAYFLPHCWAIAWWKKFENREFFNHSLFLILIVIRARSRQLLFFLRFYFHQLLIVNVLSAIFSSQRWEFELFTATTVDG